MNPVVISTWKHGINANKEAYRILSAGGNSLDAVEAGVKVAEDDPSVLSVGYGGLPDAEGRVTLDAAIMDWKARIGAVISVENIRNPISLARLVLENTEHTILAGNGAKEFALKNGFKTECLLTEYSLKRYSEWLKSGYGKSQELHTGENSGYPGKTSGHDTIGMIAIDNDGNLSAAVTTSGVAWKLPGRVGDSPVIGSGLYVDSEAGAAASTGRGEECIRACGSFLIVELMRNGLSPSEACRIACERVYKLNYLSSKNRDHLYQVGFIAMNIKGEYGAYSVRDGFQYALYKDGKNILFDSEHFLNEKYIIEDL